LIGFLAKELYHHPYRIINSLLIAVIVGILFYSASFSPDTGKYPIHSNYKLLTGDETLSTGLSRGFSCIIRLRFEEARQYNVYSLRIFAFFIIQLILRIISIAIIGKQLVDEIRPIAFLDITISALLFVYCFWPFLIETFESLFFKA
jgi:hypothetical protein